jgi:hypothetical protein
MVNGRTKGASAEREFIALIQEIVDDALGDKRFELHRNLDQTRAGGCDVAGAPPEYDFVAVEIKRQEQLSIDKWWEQACSQARPGQVPVLAYRQKRQPWRVVMRVKMIGTDDTARATIGLSYFAEWYSKMLQENRRKN